MKRGSVDSFLALVACLASTACVPMTFSNEGELDFETYRSARVQVEAPMQDPSSYLAAELERSSGFQIVTTKTNDPVDLVLTVTVQVDVEVSTEDDGTTDIDYRGTATFTATDARGSTVHAGMETDTSEEPSEAAEDVLDEVALRFLSPYRI